MMEVVDNEWQSVKVSPSGPLSSNLKGVSIINLHKLHLREIINKLILSNKDKSRICIEKED